MSTLSHNSDDAINCFHGSTVTVSSSTLADNSPRGILASDSTVTIASGALSSTLARNAADYGGGISR